MERDRSPFLRALGGGGILILLSSCRPGIMGVRSAASVPLGIQLSAPTAARVSSRGTASFQLDYTGAEEVNLSLPDVSLISTGTANCSVSLGAVSAAEILQTIDLTNCVGDGAVQIFVRSGTARFQGAPAKEVGPSSAFKVVNTPPVSATQLVWNTSTPTNHTALAAAWARSSDPDLSKQRVQLFSDGSCALTVGASIDVSTSASVATLSGVNGQTYSYKVTSEDSVGNQSVSSCSPPLLVDTSAPSIAITFPGAVSYINSGTVQSLYRVDGLCSEDGREVSGILDDSAVPAQAGGTCDGTSFSLRIDTTSLSEGVHSLQVRITDSAGNSAVAAAVSLRKDLGAPVATLLRLAGGAAGTALPLVLVEITGSDPVSGGYTSGLAEMQLSESTTISPSSWVPFSTTAHFGLSQSGGSKTVHLWIRDLAGNVSPVLSQSITLDFGNPPVVSLLTPVANATYSAGDSIPISWSCSSVNGLDSHPVSLKYTRDDGATFETPSIATDLTNNLTATTGSTPWTMPSLSGMFRILVSCKSAAGVVNSAYSQPINSGGWSIFLGDSHPVIEDVNASVADVSGPTVMSYRASISGDAAGNVFFQKGSAIMKVDAVSGQVTRFAGTVKTPGCLVADGHDAISFGADRLSYPVLLGPAVGGDGILVHSQGCSQIFKIRSTDRVATLMANVPQPDFWVGQLTKDGFLVYGLGSIIFKLDLRTPGNTAVQIIGNGTCLASSPSIGADALTTSIVTCQPFALMANHDATKIWTGTQRFDWNEGAAKYQLGSNSFPFGEGYRQCTSTLFDQKIYCPGWSEGRGIRVFDPATETWGTPSQLPFADNDDSGGVSLGSGPASLLAHYTLNAIDSIIPNATGAWDYTNIAGQPLATFGNGSDRSAVALLAPEDIHYNDATQALWISSFFGHLRRVDFTSSPRVTATLVSSSIYGSSFAPTSLNLAGDQFVSFHSWCYGGWHSIALSALSVLGLESFLNASCDLTPVYPFVDGALVSDPTTSLAYGNFSDHTAPLLHSGHSGGVLYFVEHAGTSDVMILSSDRFTLHAVAGKTGAGGYNSGDDGSLAIGASLTSVDQMQEIPVSSPYAGDLLIWDANHLRRISIATEAGAPKIYDVLVFSLAPSYVMGTTFYSTHYDFASEALDGGGLPILGSGKIYYVDTSFAVHRFQADSTLSSASDTTYSLTGTQITGLPRLTLSPDGLLVLQPERARILRLAP